MKQHIDIITLAVDDLEVSNEFYSEKLGWKSLEPGMDGIVFYDIGTGMRFAIYPRDEMAKEFGDFKVDLATGG